MKWIQITDVIKWIAVCVAISISVYVTRDGRYKPRSLADTNEFSKLSGSHLAANRGA